MRALGAADDVAATYKLAVGLLVYPVCWVVEGWLAWRLGGPWLLAAFAAGLVPGGLIALSWQDRWDDFRRRTLGFAHYLADRDHHADLARRRRAVTARLEALMDGASGGGRIRER